MRSVSSLLTFLLMVVSGCTKNICSELRRRECDRDQMVFEKCDPLVSAYHGQPMFSGAFAKAFDIMRLRHGFFLNGIAFGIGLGLLYSLLAKVMPSRSTVA